MSLLWCSRALSRQIQFSQAVQHPNGCADAVLEGANMICSNLRFLVAVTISCFVLILAAQAQSPSRAAAVLDSMPHAKSIEQAAISPDGTQIAYIVGGELSVITAAGGTPRAISVEGN